MSSGRKKLAITLALPVTLWAAAALFYDVRVSWLRLPLAFLYGFGVIALWWRTKASRSGMALWAGSVLLVIAWWFTLKPSNDRPWQPDVAQLPWAEVRGDLVTLHNVRNFDYRTETDYVQRWETRVVNLQRVQGVDLFVTRWGAPLIAHVIVSFHFSDPAGQDQFVAMSIEARKTVGQDYSALRGFFRQYELIYLVADERDVVRLRTNYRVGEFVRLYRTLLNPVDARNLFMQYLRWIEEQRNHPHWYNAITDNCSSSITSYLAAHHIGGFPWWDPRLLLNGMGEQMLYQDGDLATGGLSFTELTRQAAINGTAQKLDQDPGFSVHIRQGRPGF